MYRLFLLTCKNKKIDIKFIYMPVPKKVINFLEKNRARYEIVEHRTVYTAFDKVKTLKVKPNIVGKTLVLKGDKDLIFVLIPANKNLDKNKFKKIVNIWRKKQGKKSVKKIEFVSERVIKNKIKGVKLGAIPPFGSLFGYPTFVNKSLLSQRKIILNSGIPDFSVRITTASFKKIIPDMISANFVKAKK